MNTSSFLTTTCSFLNAVWLSVEGRGFPPHHFQSIFFHFFENYDIFSICGLLAPTLFISQNKGELIFIECLRHPTPMPSPVTAVLGPGEPQWIKARSLPRVARTHTLEQLTIIWCGKCHVGDLN